MFLIKARRLSAMWLLYQRVQFESFYPSKAGEIGVKQHAVSTILKIELTR